MEKQPKLNTVPISRARILKAYGAVWIPYLRNPKLFGSMSTLGVAIASSANLFRELVLSSPSNNLDNCDTPTIVTFTINPDLVRLWYFFVTHSLGQKANILIVDSAGLLRQKQFPNAKVIHLWNFTHSRKIDYITEYVAKTRYLWICDDDVMVINPNSIVEAMSLLQEDKKTAVVSFIPNDVDLMIEQKTYPGMGSYSLMIDRKAFLDEHLSFSAVNTDNFQFNRGTGHYDTGDFANEQLIRRGYQVKFLLDEQDEVKYVCGFDGVDSARLRLLEGKEKFLKDIANVDIRTARHRINGTYCNWKVVELYRTIFNEEPSWIPPISLDELQRLIFSLGDDYKNAILKQLALYDLRLEILKKYK